MPHSFTWERPICSHPNWKDCEQATLAENRYAYLVACEDRQWFVMHQDQMRRGEYWFRYATTKEEAKRFAEEHARALIQ